MSTAQALNPAAAASPSPVRSAVITPASLSLPPEPTEESRPRRSAGLGALRLRLAADLIEDRGAVRPGLDFGRPAGIRLRVGLPAVRGESTRGPAEEVSARRGEARRLPHVLEPAGDPLFVLELHLAQPEPVLRLLRREAD